MYDVLYGSFMHPRRGGGGSKGEAPQDSKGFWESASQPIKGFQADIIIAHTKYIFLGVYWSHKSIDFCGDARNRRAS